MAYRILHTEASKGWGGQEKRIIDEILYMRESGHKFYIACQPDSRILVEARMAGIECFALKMRSSVCLRAICSLAGFIKKNKIDIVNTHSSKDSWIAGFSRLLVKIPLLVRTRHLSTPVTNKFVYTRLTDFIVTTAESIKTNLIGIGIDKDKIRSIPTGVNEGRYSSEECNRKKARVDLGLKDGEIAVGNVGILRSWKGHIDFIDVAQKILEKKDNVKFFIAGDGPQRNSLKRIIEERDLFDKVIMLGYRDDVPQVLSALDIFLFTSYANEGVPQAVLQALAMKKGVVATDVGGVAEVVKDGQTGFLCDIHDIEKMREGVNTLIEDRQLRLTYGENGRKLVLGNFTIRHTCERMEEVYKRFLLTF